MSTPSSKFKGSEVIFLFLGAGILFMLASPVVLLLRSSALRALVMLTIGLVLNAIGLVLGHVRARREPPGDSSGAS